MEEIEDTGSRESPLLYDGGLRFGPPGAHMQGVIWRGHPPLECPNPRISSSRRGYYHCPACAEKVRLAGHQTGREIGYELADRWMDALAGALLQARDLLWRRPRGDDDEAVSEASDCQECDL